MTPDDDPARDLAHTPRDPDFERVVRASFARQGFLVDNGAELVAVGPGRISIALPYRAAITQQQGYFHGAAIGAIADSASGYAALSLMAPDSEVVTVEYKINFLALAEGARLIADGVVLRAGRSLTVGQSDVFAEAADGTRKRIALLQGTFSRVALS